MKISELEGDELNKWVARAQQWYAAIAFVAYIAALGYVGMEVA